MRQLKDIRKVKWLASRIRCNAPKGIKGYTAVQYKAGLDEPVYILPVFPDGTVHGVGGSMDPIPGHTFNRERFEALTDGMFSEKYVPGDQLELLIMLISTAFSPYGTCNSPR